MLNKKMSLIHSLILISFVVLTYAKQQIWNEIGPADANTEISFIVGLKHYVDHKEFVKRHTPGHPTYHNGHFMTRQEVRQSLSQYMGECRQVAEQFAQTNGISLSSISEFNEYYQVNTTVAKVEKIFDAKMYVYSNGLREIIRLDRNHSDYKTSSGIPTDVKDCISFWGRLWDFPGRTSKIEISLTSSSYSKGGKQQQMENSGCPENVICPQTIAAMYGIPDQSHVTPPSNIHQLIFEEKFASDQQGNTFESIYSPSDLQAYQSAFGLPQNGFTNINGGTGTCSPSSGACAEPSLDVQVLVGTNTMNTPESQNLYLNFDDATGMIQTLNSVDWSKVAVVSVSYGGGEVIDTDVAICNELKTISDQGATILVASGDQGANLGACADITQECKYTTEFPASCPYVTAVGGTYGFAANTEVGATAQDNQCAITSGGGFSAVFVSDEYDLSWQSSQVQTYIDNYLGETVGGLKSAPSPFAGKGRALPDISAAACNFLVVLGGEQTYGTCGTSASTPLIAGVISMIAMRNNRTFGFINPTLYANPDIFYDVTTGANFCGNSYQGCPIETNGEVYGYFASKGWDPVTGLGTLGQSNTFEALEAALMGQSVPPTGGSQAPNAAVSVSSNLIMVMMIAVMFLFK